MPDLTSRLTVELLDRVSGPAKNAAGGLKGFAGDVKNVQGQLKSLSNFKVTLGDFRVARQSFNTAKADVKRLADEYKAAWKAIKDFEGVKLPRTDAMYKPLQEARKRYADIGKEYRTAIRSVKNASKEFEAQAAAIKNAKAATGAVNFNDLIKQEERLAKAARATNDAYVYRGRFANQGGTGTGSGSRVGSGSPSSPMTRGKALATGAAAGAGWSLWQGFRDSIMVGFDFQEQGNKMMSQGQADWKTAEALQIYSKQYAEQTGYVTPIQAAEIATELLKAGVKPNAVKSVMPNVAGLARFGDVDPLTAADTIISTGAGFRMPMGTPEEAAKTSQYIADNVAQAAASTRGGVGDFQTGLKYTSGIASMMGLTPQQTLAMLMTMVQSGQDGASAGTALRSALVTGIKPTLGSRQALAELGLNISDYATGRRAIDPADAVSGMENRFGKLPTGAVDRLSKVLEGSDTMGFEQIQDAMVEFFVKETKSTSAQDREKVVKASRLYLESQLEDLDFEALLTDLQGKNITPAQGARIFNPKHSARLAALFRDQMYQMFLGVLESAPPGTAQTQAELQMANGVGLFKRGANYARESAITFTQAGMRAPGWLAEGLGYVWNGWTGGGIKPSGPATPASGLDGAGRIGGGHGGGGGGAWPQDATAKVKIDGADEAKQQLGSVVNQIDAFNGRQGVANISVSGVDSAIGKIKELLGLINRVNASEVSPAVRGVHADIGPTGGGGW